MANIYLNKILTVVVVVDNKERYIHKCTEELLFGILSVTKFSNRFTLYYENNTKPIILEDIKDNYHINKGFKNYTAILKICNVTFNTPDVIQGIITASMWLNEDPHKYIMHIRQDNIKVNF